MGQILAGTVVVIWVAASVAGCTSTHETISSRAQQSRDSEAYGKYRNDVAHSNIELEKGGQTPVPVLTREEWAKSEAATKEAGAEK